MWPASVNSNERCRRAKGVQRFALGPGPASARQELGVLLLDLGGVGEHHGAEVPGGRGGVDRAVEAVAHQQGQAAGVVDVGVAQDHGVEPPRVERQGAVELARLLARALEQAGVQGDAGPGRLEEMERTRDPARRAVEGELEGHRVPKIRSPASPRPGRM
jgi:hypothetical protein